VNKFYLPPPPFELIPAPLVPFFPRCFASFLTLHPDFSFHTPPVILGLAFPPLQPLCIAVHQPAQASSSLPPPSRLSFLLRFYDSFPSVHPRKRCGIGIPPAEPPFFPPFPPASPVITLAKVVSFLRFVSFQAISHVASWDETFSSPPLSFFSSPFVRVSLFFFSYLTFGPIFPPIITVLPLNNLSPFFPDNDFWG